MISIYILYFLAEIFSFTTQEFALTHWRIFMIVALKFLSDNSAINSSSHVGVCWLPFLIQVIIFPYFLVWWVILSYILDILDVTLGESGSYLKRISYLRK